MRTTIQLEAGRRRSNSNPLFTYSYSLLAITRRLLLELHLQRIIAEGRFRH
jgi:hypothetical protein